VNLAAVRGDDDLPFVLLGAHWDSKEEASDGGAVPGANDGASGVGLLLQLMRHLADAEGLPYRVGVVLFDAEDGFEDCHPLAGSTVYAAALPQGRPDLLLLLDMVGDDDARFPREAHSVASAPGVVDHLWTRAHRHGLGANFVNFTRSSLDDHVPFTDRGVQAVDVIDLGRPGGFPPYWHTRGDDVSVLDAGMLGRMGDLVVDVLDDDALLPAP
jgi:glutaminyl-peptide cyclotransferase